MEVLSEEQALQSMFGKDLGLDNEGLSFQELEDYITGNDNICIPEDAIPAVAYSNGRPPDVCGGAGDLKLNLRLQNHPHAPQMAQSMHQTSSVSYCNIPPPRLGYDTQLHLKHPSLPDSPPDSGSEPYSPPDGTHPNHDSKLGLGNNINVVPQHMYPPPPHRGGPPHMPLPPSKVPVTGGYMNCEPPKLNHLPTTQPSSTAMPPHQISPPLSHPILPPHLGSMNNLSNHPSKKRKYSDSPNNTVTSSILSNMNTVMNIKQEPQGPDFSANNFTPYGLSDCNGDDDYSYDIDGNGAFMDSTYQVIKWQVYQPTKWAVLTDSELKDLPALSYRVDADKGFNFSVPDDAFVCQKKNHFQVTVHIGMQGDPRYVRTPEGVKKIEHFYLHFHGIKMESPTQTIKVEQSQSDRSKKPFYPVKVDVTSDQVTKVTVGRLHFSETTSNNMRKKGKPNPDQRYFMLVVALHAHSGDSSYMVASSASERIIVRASNPGQFDSDVDVQWQKGHTQDSVYHVGRVGINTDHPEEALTVHGNLRLTGHLIQPSDIRAKENLKEVNTKEQLENVQKMRLYHYSYSEDYRETAGMAEKDRNDTGVIAQEILEVLPDAVKETGDVILPSGQTIENFLVVNKDRIFMENVGAVKELCKLTDNLENRIDELERMNTKLTKLKRFDSLKSTISSKSGSSISTVSSAPPKKSNSGSSSHHHSSSKKYHKHASSSSSSSSSRRSAPHKGMCSNRFIQITIIILILIMAFCLVAITTLYILERHKETKPAHPTVLEATPTATQNRGNQNSSDLLPTKVPAVSDRGRVKGTTRGKISTVASMSSTTASEGQTSFIISTVSPTARPPVMPPFPSCGDSCEQRCCPAPPEDMPNTQYKSHSGEDHDSTNNVDYVVTAKTTSLNTVVINNFDQSQNDPNVINNNYNTYNVINNDNVIGYRNRRSLRSRRKRRESETESQAQIRIKELNFSIGSEYCTSCRQQNFSYFIHLSRYFGFQPTTLQFTMSRPAYVGLCSNTTFASCQGAEPSQAQLMSNRLSVNAEWRLSIGVHFRTTFRFRISQDNAHPCSVPPGEVDSSVWEYTLVFQRTCQGDDSEM